MIFNVEIKQQEANLKVAKTTDPRKPAWGMLQKEVTCQGFTCYDNQIYNRNKHMFRSWYKNILCSVA